MVKSLVIAGALIVSTDGARDLISKKSRFLIQSVVKNFDFVNQLFEHYREKEVKDGDFCEPTLSLMALDPQKEEEGYKALPLLIAQSKAANAATGAVSQHLKEATNNIIADRVRASDEVMCLFEQESKQEIDSVLGAIEKALKKLEKEAESSKNLNVPGKVLPLMNDHVFPVAAGQTKFSENPNERTLEAKVGLIDTNPVAGPASHTAATWGDMEAKFTSGSEALKKIRDSINEMLDEVEAQLNVHKAYLDIKSNFDLKKQEITANQQSGETREWIGTLFDALNDKLSHEDYKKILKYDGNEPASGMARLTTALSYLHLHKIGIKDAKNANNNLKTTVEKAKNYLKTRIQGHWNAIKNGLKEIPVLVYKEAEKLPGIEIDRTMVKNGEYIDEVRTLFESTTHDSIAELMPMINMVVNSVWRVHTHLLGIVSLSQSDDFSSRSAADCLLYDRVDALFVGLKLDNPKEADCGNFREAGIAKIEELMKFKAREVKGVAPEMIASSAEGAKTVESTEETDERMEAVDSVGNLLSDEVKRAPESLSKPDHV